MEITLLDRSNYYKGLLLLIAKDKKISDNEKEYLLKLGKVLGFESQYCEQNIDTVIENKYITDDPIKFSNQELARVFIRDGIKIAFADDALHLTELEWLRSVLEKNNLSDEWFKEEVGRFVEKGKHKHQKDLEIQNYWKG